MFTSYLYVKQKISSLSVRLQEKMTSNPLQYLQIAVFFFLFFEEVVVTIHSKLSTAISMTEN